MPRHFASFDVMVHIRTGRWPPAASNPGKLYRGKRLVCLAVQATTTIEELRQDLRVVLRKCRPDWDITRPELKAAWERVNMIASIPMARLTGRFFGSKSKRPEMPASAAFRATGRKPNAQRSQFGLTHERGTSHYELLRAFVDNEILRRIDQELNAHDYRTHEFGDSVFLERAANRTCRGAQPSVAA